MSDYLKCDFCFLNFWMRRAVSENCLVALRFSKNLNALLFRCSMNVSSRTRLRVGFRCFEGHFRTRWCLRCVFCSVMHHCVVRRSGSVPTEITEPALEARSSRHVFIETCKAKTSRQAYWSAAISRSQPSGCILIRSQKSYWKPCHIRNSLGTIYFFVWEVCVL